VKGVRFSDPGCLPSAATTRERARAEARTHPAWPSSESGVHVMRIAAPRRTTPLLPTAFSLAYAGKGRCRSGSRSRAPWRRSGFRPDRRRWRVSLSPKVVYRLLH
jgi:hypothetical protein